MTKQLRLLETRRDWRLDDRTREIGRQGVAQARAALRENGADAEAVDVERPAA